MLKTVEKQAWDGAWYTRAFDAAGHPVGSKACEEGKIFIESQAWCVLGGAGRNNGRAKKALQAVDKYLYTPDLGCALQYPPYSEYHLELGEVSSYPPGYKENAGVFSHNNTWIHIGWTLFGEGEKALEYYLSICPSAKKDHDVYRSRALRLRPDDGLAVLAHARRGQELLAHRHRRLVVCGRQPVHPRRAARLHRPAHRPVRSEEVEGLHGQRKFRGVTYTIEVKNPRGESRA